MAITADTGESHITQHWDRYKKSYFFHHHSRGFSSDSFLNLETCVILQLSTSLIITLYCWLTKYYFLSLGTIHGGSRCSLLCSVKDCLNEFHKFQARSASACWSHFSRCNRSFSRETTQSLSKISARSSLIPGLFSWHCGRYYIGYFFKDQSVIQIVGQGRVGILLSILWFLAPPLCLLPTSPGLCKWNKWNKLHHNRTLCFMITNINACCP